MKKLFLCFLASFFLLTSQAYAVPVPFYLDLSNEGVNTSGGGVTDLLSQISFVQNSEIIQQVGNPSGFPSIGDTFTENGVGFADGFTFAPGAPVLNPNDAGLNSEFEMTFTFNNLTGSITNQVGNIASFNFDQTGTVNVYVDDGIAGNLRTPTVDTTDPLPLSAYSGYDDGEQIAQFNVERGQGSLDLVTGTGSTFLWLTFVDDSAYYDIWFDELGRDLVEEQIELVVAFVDSTQKNVTSDPDFPTPGASEYTFSSTGNGGLEINVVPEPTTMLLFGIGLLGLAGVTRRKNLV